MKSFSFRVVRLQEASSFWKTIFTSQYVIFTIKSKSIPKEKKVPEKYLSEI